MPFSIENGHTYIIAEAGVNHDGNIERAYELIDSAADAGADAVKFQLFNPTEVTSPAARKAEYQIANEGKGDDIESQQEMLQRLTLKLDDYRELKKYTESKGIDFITTPFDAESARFLASLGVKKMKIPSGEVTNLPFLEQVAKLGIDTVISTGMCNLEDIDDAIAVFKKHGTSYSLLHCVSSYPAPAEQINLRAMNTMRAKFNVSIGYSDHTVGIDASLAAVAMGAQIIEKHFTYDKEASGPDHAASLEPQELKEMVRGIRLVEKARDQEGVNALQDEARMDRIFQSSELSGMVDLALVKKMLGDGVKQCQPCEADVLKMGRRSCQVTVDVKKGDVLTREMIAIRRPADDGLPPKKIDEIVGKKAARDLAANSLLRQDDIAW